MTDESGTSETSQDRTSRAVRQRPVFDRAFPGPSPLDPRFQTRLEAIARAAELRRQHGQQQRERRRHEAAVTGEPAAPSTSDELAQLRDAMHEQTEVLRALLDADVAIRDDARATAQNSRTFAVAGIVIAFFTLIATVVTVVIAFAPQR